MAVALFARLVYCFLIFPRIGDDLFWRGVDDGYDELARNVLGGHGYAMAPGRPGNLLTPPGYAYALAGLYTLFGSEVNEGPRLWIAQSAVDAITCGAIFAIGALTLKNRRVGLAAAAIWAVYPQMAVYAARVAPEVLFTFLFVLLYAAWLELEARGGAARALAAGGVWGALVLTKEKVILLPAILLARLLWTRRGRPGAALREGALFLAAALIVIGPWLWRGYQLTGGFVPITLRGGRALTEGERKDFSGTDSYMVDGFERELSGPMRPMAPLTPLTEEERLAATRALREREASRLSATLAEIAASPFEFLRKSAVRAAAYWYWGQERVILGNALVNIPLLLLGIFGLVRARGTPPAALAALFIVYMNAIHALTVVRMRYCLPVVPFVVLFAALFLVGRRAGALADRPQGPKSAA